MPAEDARQLAEVAQFAGELSSLSRELLSSCVGGAKQSTEQRRCVLECLALQERIRSYAEKSAANSREAASRTEALVRDADRGSETLAATVLHMQQMVEVVAASADLMQQFVLHVSEVDGVVANIGEIARETNLLALNAAIEAANAGRKGDGFSVIAHEIRVLADRASKSTVEIGDRIEAMCAIARDTEAAMLKGRFAVEEGIKQTTSLQQSFEALRGAMYRVESMVTEVALASDRQIVAVERVAQGMQKINNLALRNADEADVSAERSMRIDACADGLHKALAQMGMTASKATGCEREGAENLAEKIAAHQPRVDRAIALLRAKCCEAGAPALTADPHSADSSLLSIQFGDMQAAEAHPWLESITEETHCFATIFACSGKGRPEERFLRVATSLKCCDGSPGIGSILNPRSFAVGKLIAKQTYCGTVYVLGRPFLSIYEPLLSASGSVIGAIYVGHPLE